MCSSDLGELDSALADAKRALEGEDHGAIKSAFERLTQASHKLAEAMYQRASGAGAGAAGEAPPPPAGGAEDGVIDAEYVDVDKKQ